jgi:hypothetical protein
MWRAVFDGLLEENWLGLVWGGVRKGDERRRGEERKRTGLCNSFASRRLCESEVLDPHVRVQIE